MSAPPPPTGHVGAHNRADPRACVSQEQEARHFRKGTFGASDGSPILARERLYTLTVAFLADTRPGLIFEYRRLVFANDAARTLLRSTETSAEFLNGLKISVSGGALQPGLLLRTRSGVYAPVLHPTRNRRAHPTRICFLVKVPEATAAYASLSERELDVLRLLVKGLTNGEMAHELGISIETVRKHISHALEKTGTTTRAGLVGRALGVKDVTRSGNRQD